ncbi:MAG: hypothetical protein AB1781_11150 [Pseudomonadota bacterium]
MVAYDPTDVNLLALFSGWFSKPVTEQSSRSPVTEQRAADLVIPPTVTDAELDELRQLLRRLGPLSNKQVARLMKVTKGEASKRVSKAVAAGMVSRTKIGKEVAITLH